MDENLPEIPPESGQVPQPDSNVTNPKPALRQWLAFAAGFISWYGVNTLIWLIFFRNNPNIFSLVISWGVMILPLNIIALFILSRIKRARWFSLGVLAAWAVNFAISIIMGVYNNAVCLMPFYIPDQTIY